MGHGKIKFRKRLVRIFRSTVVGWMRKCNLHPVLYKSWWHMLFSSARKHHSETNYVTARPNPLESIAHQVRNWASGLYFANEFGLRFAHTRFPDVSWDAFLGLGEKDPSSRQLHKRDEYCKVRLPWFDPEKAATMKLVRKIIASYVDKKVVFVLENDQPCPYCSKLIVEISNRFNTGLARKDEKLIFEPDSMSVVLFIPGFAKREAFHKVKDSNKAALNTHLDFFKKAIERFSSELPAEKNPRFYIFSRAKEEYLSDFKSMGDNVSLCLRTSERYSLLHMIRADLLISTNNDFASLAAAISTSPVYIPGIDEKCLVDLERVVG